MTNYVILLADNDPAYRTAIAKTLAREGYKVVEATSRDDTVRLLEEGKVDLALLDVRLVDDHAAHDISGLRIAANPAFRHIPKVVLTGFDLSPEHVRQLLGLDPEQAPPALYYVLKGEGHEALLGVIRAALDLWPFLHVSTMKVARQIREDYETVQSQAKRNYWMTISVSAVGFIAIFLGIALAWSGGVTIAIVGSATGLLVQAISYLYFTRLDLANERMDRYHKEILELYWLEFTVGMCQKLPLENRLACIERALIAAVQRRFAPPGSPAAPGKTPKRAAVQKIEGGQNEEDNRVYGQYSEVPGPVGEIA
jgi:CheY-like chemotaxis protein